MKSIYFIVIAIFFSCSKTENFVITKLPEPATKILGHMGSGSGNQLYEEDTFEGAKFGLSQLNGIELDLQISKSGTLWLGHNSALPDCSIYYAGCFSAFSDDELMKLDSCLGNEITYSRLEEVFIFMAENYPEKHISLDVKAWFPCLIARLNTISQMNKIADEIVRLAIKYKLERNILVESATQSFLNRVRSKSKEIECYYMALDKFENAMELAAKNNYSGISYKFKTNENLTPELVETYRTKGLKLQLWTVNSAEAIQKALLLKPDYLQTDSMNLSLFELK